MSLVEVEKYEEPVITKKVANKALFASFIGSVIEWFDYLIYGTVAALVFNQLFFPNFNPVVGLLLSYVSFSLTFLIRPLGGILFSHIGDKIGRKKSLVLTLVLMGGSTFLIGLLPDYSTIGVWAPILLLTLRCVQGLGIGGEWGGAILLAVEYSGKDTRGFFGSIPQLGVPVGMLMGTLVFSILGTLPNEQFMSWGWRVPFILSAALVLVGLWIRNGLEETPIFQEAQKKGKIAKLPIAETFRNHWKTVLIAVGLVVGTTGPFYIFSNFVIAYSTTYLGFDRVTSLNAVTLGALASAIAIPIIGKLSDKFGRKTVFLCGMVGTIFFTFPYFYLLSFKSAVFLTIVTIVALVIWSFGYAVQGTMYAEMFSTRVRYTGMTIGYQLGVALAGGTAPLIAILLLNTFNNSWISVAIYTSITSLISLIALSFVREAKGRELE